MSRHHKRRRDDRVLLAPALPRNPRGPDALVDDLRPEEVPPPPALERRLLNAHNSYLRVYRFGECSVIVTKELGRWHLSIAHPRRYPDWDEISGARYTILPRDLWFAMYLPPPERYTNLHRNCFQLIECEDPDK